jgi:hypothetical protein
MITLPVLALLNDVIRAGYVCRDLKATSPVNTAPCSGCQNDFICDAHPYQCEECEACVATNCKDKSTVEPTTTPVPMPTNKPTLAPTACVDMEAALAESDDAPANDCAAVKKMGLCEMYPEQAQEFCCKTCSETVAPTIAPTTAPTTATTSAPTYKSSATGPAPSPATLPTLGPTKAPPTKAPTKAPTNLPTLAPTGATTAPTASPTGMTSAPTLTPTFAFVPGASKRFLLQPWQLRQDAFTCDKEALVKDPPERTCHCGEYKDIQCIQMSEFRFFGPTGKPVEVLGVCFCSARVYFVTFTLHKCLA